MVQIECAKAKCVFVWMMMNRSLRDLWEWNIKTIIYTFSTNHDRTKKLFSWPWVVQRMTLKQLRVWFPTSKSKTTHTSLSLARSEVLPNTLLRCLRSVIFKKIKKSVFLCAEKIITVPCLHELRVVFWSRFKILWLSVSELKHCMAVASVVMRRGAICWLGTREESFGFGSSGGQLILAGSLQPIKLENSTLQTHISLPPQIPLTTTKMCICHVCLERKTWIIWVRIRWSWTKVAY